MESVRIPDLASDFSRPWHVPLICIGKNRPVAHQHSRFQEGNTEEGKIATHPPPIENHCFRGADLVSDSNDITRTWLITVPVHAFCSLGFALRIHVVVSWQLHRTAYGSNMATTVSDLTASYPTVQAEKSGLF